MTTTVPLFAKRVAEACKTREAEITASPGTWDTIRRLKSLAEAAEAACDGVNVKTAQVQVTPDDFGLFAEAYKKTTLPP